MLSYSTLTHRTYYRDAPNDRDTLFHEIPGGTCIDVQGLPCWIPPVGQIWDPLTNRWTKIPVYRRTNQFAGCYWERDQRWKLVPGWIREEARLQAPTIEENKKREKRGLDPLELPYHEGYNSFQTEMWKYRLGGFWYYNNDEPTYLTGLNWYFLSVYEADFPTPTRHPKYRDVDRLFFYAWQYCVEDPDCYGLVEVTKRRSGKSYRAGCIALEGATRSEHFHAGIQSKNDDDARDLFKGKVVAPYRKLPQFFKPKYDNMKKSAGKPAAELRFSADTEIHEGDELESWVDFRSAEPLAYDSQKLQIYVEDEAGKSKKVDVWQRWDKVKPCLRDDERNIIGKSIHTTTVEDMDTGGRAFVTMWKNSDQNSRQKEGRKRTKSGLYRIFFPADMTGKLDLYGRADRERVRQEILDERAGLEARDEANAKRKDPLSVEEAFQFDAANCIFNIKKLTMRQEILQGVQSKPMWRRGNFHWKEGKRDTEVYFLENPEGRFMMMYDPPASMRNRKIERGGYFIPAEKSGGAIGVDPYDHTILAEGGEYTMSLGAIVGMKRANPMDNTPVENGPAFIYLARPDNPETLFEDAIMACHYYGWQANIENNKPRCVLYFEDRMYGEYVYKKEGATKRGISASARNTGGGTNALIAEILDTYVEENIDKIWFLEIIEQLLGFTPTDTTKWDLVMAMGYAYMLLQRIDVKENRKGKRKTPRTVGSYMVFNQRQRRGLIG